ncbi:MAG: hypothetical protein FWG31_08955 [Oscillospiraceae bacterium]|nr:hypothetical protein [Oscillospiraceae bacterium]
MKKAIISLSLALVLTLTLAIPALAVISGWIEDNEDYFRIEIFNEWGEGKQKGDVTVPADKVLEVTFSIKGLDALGLSGYTAYLGTSGDWAFKTDSPHKVSIKGDGTYKITAKFDDEVKIENVLVIDIAGLASALGMDASDKLTHPLTITADYKVVDPSTPGGSKKSGDGTMIALSIAALALAAGATVFFVRKVKA